MTGQIEERTWELRPRCLVVVPGLSFEEFAEGPWASIRGTSESVNFWTGDLLVVADREFGERASQLFDESMTPARMAQLKWLAEAIPPTRRRDDCAWTVHREVAGLFARRRGIFPAAYLDRKTEHQDALLARAGAERWTADRMKTEVKALEDEALNSITRRNEPPEEIEPTPIPERATVVDPEPKPPEAADGEDAVDGAGSSSETDPGERGAGPATSLPRTPGDTGTLGRAEEAGGSPAPDYLPGAGIAEPEVEIAGNVVKGAPDATTIPEDDGGRTAGSIPATGAIIDRAELRACIDAVRAAPAAPLADEARIAAALGKPGLDLGNTDRVLTAFTQGWRLKIEQQVDDAGKSRWSVMAMKAGAQRAMGINPTLSYAVAETALGAILSDMPQETPPRPIVTVTPSLPPRAKHKTLALTVPAGEFDTPLMRLFCPCAEGIRAKLRKWALLGFVLKEPAPSLGEDADLFIAAYIAASEGERKPFRVALLKIEEAA